MQKQKKQKEENHEIFKTFTIAGRAYQIEQGIVPEIHTLSNGTEINIIVVGEKGRGRKKTFLPINANKPVYHVSLGTTKNGNTRLYTASPVYTTNAALIVAKVKGGFRGYVTYSGDVSESWYECQNCLARVLEPELSVHYKNDHDYNISHNPKAFYDIKRKFAAFDCLTIAEGNIAEGAAGRAGSHQQIIFLLPKDKVITIQYGGRLYGEDPYHYVHFNGEIVTVLSQQERDISDLF